MNYRIRVQGSGFRYVADKSSEARTCGAGGSLLLLLLRTFRGVRLPPLLCAALVELRELPQLGPHELGRRVGGALPPGLPAQLLGDVLVAAAGHAVRGAYKL